MTDLIKVVGESGIVIEIEESIATGLISAGHVKPVDDPKKPMLKKTTPE